MLVPEYRAAFAVIVGFNPVFQPVLPRRWDTGLIEPPVDPHVADALRAPLEYLANDRGGLRVNDQMILVFWIFAVPMRRIVSDIVPPLHFCLQSRGNFTGDVLCIIIVYDVGQRHRQLCRICDR